VSQELVWEYFTCAGPKRISDLAANLTDVMLDFTGTRPGCKVRDGKACCPPVELMAWCGIHMYIRYIVAAWGSQRGPLPWAGNAALGSHLSVGKGLMQAYRVVISHLC
jgi:hypothetical protein